MRDFYLNGRLWHIKFVDPHDPELVDRTGVLTVATTDPIKSVIFLSAALNGEFLYRVFYHELGHAAMISYNMLDVIHRMVKPQYWVEMEEWICNFLADYGPLLLNTGHAILGGQLYF